MTTSRLVYSTDKTTNTVTIDYNGSLRLFLSTREQHTFSAERLLRMLNGWAQVRHVRVTVVGRLQIVVGDVHCELTQQAIAALCRLYLARREWQIDFPDLVDLFAKVSAACDVRERGEHGATIIPSFACQAG